MGKPLFHNRSEEIIQKTVFVIIPSDARRADGARPGTEDGADVRAGGAQEGNAGRKGKTRGECTDTATARIINMVTVAEQSEALSGANCEKAFAYIYTSGAVRTRNVRTRAEREKSRSIPGFFNIRF